MQSDAEKLEELIDHRNGLLGISGSSSVMRTLHASATSNDEARLAIRMFCQSVRKQLGAMSVVLDGIDSIVFTRGIGEHDAAVRAEICGGLPSIGVDAHATEIVDACESSGALRARCRVRVLPSLEDEQIALHAWALGQVPDRASPATAAPPAAGWWP